MQTERYYTIAQVAGRTGLSQRDVTRLFRLHKFGNCLRISETDRDEGIKEINRKIALGEKVL